MSLEKGYVKIFKGASLLDEELDNVVAVIHLDRGQSVRKINKKQKPLNKRINQSLGTYATRSEHEKTAERGRTNDPLRTVKVSEKSGQEQVGRNVDVR